jgi:cardiolipin synthase
MFEKARQCLSRILSRHPAVKKMALRLWRRRKMLLTWFLVVGHVTGALTSVRAIMEVRTAQGTIAWVFALNTVPYVSVPTYWIFGRSRFEGYVIARRKDLAQTTEIHQQYLMSLTNRGLLANPEFGHSLAVQKLARMRFTTGNDAELLVDGDKTYQSIFDGIEQAREYVLVEFYIIQKDKTGAELKRRLVEKARQGVRVYVIYDEIGSSALIESSLVELRNAGVDVRRFNTTQGRANRWQLNFRNHRKIVVVDGQAAWVGGLNVGDEYMGHDPAIGAWRDTHVKMTGPVVQGVQVAFLEDWHWASQQLLKLNWDPQPAPSGTRRVALALPTGPADSLETCTLFFLNAINTATNRLWLASPYFVPDEQFISALQLAALRGVDVRVLLPDKIDNKLVQLSGWSYVGDLEKVGVKLFRYEKGLMHQKVMLIDDRYCTIGTANFDNRSFRLNFEMTMVFADTEFSSRVRQMLEQDFAGSKIVSEQELSDRGFWFRFAVRCARLMAPVQ